MIPSLAPGCWPLALASLQTHRSCTALQRASEPPNAPPHLADPAAAAAAAATAAGPAIEQIFDEASPQLYEAVHVLMSTVLSDPVTSPFLDATACPAGVKDGRDRAVVTWQRPLLAGLACLGAHEDLGQRALLLVGLGA